MLVPPSPKFQLKVWPAIDVFVNWAVYGAQPVGGVVNWATTNGAILMIRVSVSGALQYAVSTRVNFTV